MTTHEEGTPPPEQDISHASGNGQPDIIKRLRPLNNATPEQLGAVALGGEQPDEIVPDADGITVFQGEQLRQHEASGSDKSLLQVRLERISKTAGFDD